MSDLLPSPENSKTRVELLDYEMQRTNDHAVKARATGQITAEDAGSWNETFRQWTLFANDVLYRNAWAVLSYFDVEATCQSFETRQKAMRAKLQMTPGLDIVTAREQEESRGTLAQMKSLLYIGSAVAITYAIVSVLGPLVSARQARRTADS